MNTPQQSTLEAPKLGNFRWRICALVFFATTINYLDRNVLGLLKPTLETEFHWTESDYANVVMAFQLAYALGLLFIGGLVDMFGTKKGYAVSLLGWSFAAIGHGFATTTFGFGVARAALGVTEAGNFPAANKTIGEWFPKKERSFATGLYNSGANVGAIVAPLTVPFIGLYWGWEWAFILTGAVGLLWLFFWQKDYSSPDEKLAQGKLSQAEYDYIHSDKDEVVEKGTDEQTKDGAAKMWCKLLKYRQTWSFFFGKFFTDPIWWFYLFWLPSFIDGDNQIKIEAFKKLNPDASAELIAQSVNTISMPIALAVIYTISTLGSVYGGWIPKYLMNKGMNPSKARKLTMFMIALIPLFVLSASTLGKINAWYAVLIIGLACAAHQAWSANIFTTVSDMFPKKAIASVTGIGGMAGAAGGLLIAWGAGRILDYYKALDNIGNGYAIMFIICAVAYLVAWIVMQILVPRFKQIKDL